MSATVKLITKYMLRVRRLLFFIKRMMERRFTVTIATHPAVNTVNQMMHSDKEINILSWIISPMALLFLEFVLSATVTCKKNNLWWAVWLFCFFFQFALPLYLRSERLEHRMRTPLPDGKKDEQCYLIEGAENFFVVICLFVSFFFRQILVRQVKKPDRINSDRLGPTRIE